MHLIQLQMTSNEIKREMSLETIRKKVIARHNVYWFNLNIHLFLNSTLLFCLFLYNSFDFHSTALVRQSSIVKFICMNLPDGEKDFFSQN